MIWLESRNMPWTAADAAKHTHKAVTPRLQQLWAHVANNALKRGSSDAAAIREANAAVAKEIDTDKLRRL